MFSLLIPAKVVEDDESLQFLAGKQSSSGLLSAMYCYHLASPRHYAYQNTPAQRELFRLKGHFRTPSDIFRYW